MEFETSDGFVWLKPQTQSYHNLLRACVMEYVEDSLHGKVYLSKKASTLLLGYLTNTIDDDIEDNYPADIDDLPAFCDCVEHMEHKSHVLGDEGTQMLRDMGTAFLLVYMDLTQPIVVPDHIPEEFTKQ